MARGRGGGQQRPIKGFRPGKEPPQMRKQRAQQQLGGDATRSQKMLVEALAERTPEESRAMMRRWRIGILTAGIVLAVLGALLYTWSVVAGVIVHLLAVGAFLLWFQLRRKQADFEAMADMVSGGDGSGSGARGGGGRRGRRKG